MPPTLQEFALSALDTVLPMLPKMLKAYWMVASASVLLTLLPLPFLRYFKAAVRLAAARGKLWYDRPDAKALGFLQDLSVPQQYFEHFYIVGALLTTVLLQVYIFVCCPDVDGSTLQRDSLLALLMFEVHVLRRYLETAYVMHYPETARMHLLAYLFGLSYYVAVPLTLLPSYVMDMKVLRSAFDQALGEGKEHWQSVDQRLWAAVSEPHPGLHRLAAGLALYVVATLLQYLTHSRLGAMSREGSQRANEAALVAAMLASKAAEKAVEGGKGDKKGGKGAPMVAPDGAINPDGSVVAAKVTDIYSVPKGGAFELVSCPHYLAEILIYAAIAIVTRGTEGALLITAWVVLNLVLAASATQSFYRARFPDYPLSRRALVPWLF